MISDEGSLDSKVKIFPKNLEFVDFLKSIADEKKCTVSQIALAWVLAQSDNIVIIPGTTKEKYMIQNMESRNVVLTEDDLARIQDKLSTFSVLGDRNTESGMALIDTNN